MKIIIEDKGLGNSIQMITTMSNFLDYCEKNHPIILKTFLDLNNIKYEE